MFLFFFQGATSGPFVKLGASLRAHPENMLKDLNNAGDKVFNKRLALSLVKIQLKKHSYATKLR